MSNKAALLSYLEGLSEQAFDGLQHIVVYEQLEGTLRVEVDRFIEITKSAMTTSWELQMHIHDKKSNTGIALPIITK